VLAGLKSIARPPFRVARKALWLARRKAIISRYLRSAAQPKLQVGTGFNGLPGWLNGDILPRQRDYIYLDATKPLPFADDTFAFIYTEHMIEHIGYGSARDFVRECYRVLRPGGVLRISTPDLAVITRMYATTGDSVGDEYVQYAVRTYVPHAIRNIKAFVLNNFFYNWGHAFIFDRDTLTTLLQNVGFKELSWHAPHESKHPELQRLEKHGQLIGSEEINAWQSMIVESVKAKGAL
jgi:predicted SAM-dependent methyltransferase